MPPEKKIISTFKNVILQIYTVKATTHNITKYYNTTGSHYSGLVLGRCSQTSVLSLAGSLRINDR